MLKLFVICLLSIRVRRLFLLRIIFGLMFFGDLKKRFRSGC